MKMQEIKKTVTIKGNDMDEAILAKSDNRFVLFPIQYNDVN